MYRDKNGWRVQWMRDGKRFSKTFRNKADAKRLELEIETGTVSSGNIRGAGLTFGEWCDEWLETYCRHEKAESQYRADGISIRYHLKPALGDLRLQELRRSHFHELKDTLRTKIAAQRSRPLAAKSVNLVLALARKILETAVERELLPSNPFRGARLLKLPPQRFKFWTIAEREGFLTEAAKLDPDFARLVLVAAHTGLRLGELGALQRGDLDFERRKIRVSKTWDVNTGALRQMTKGRTDEDVPMNRLVLEALAFQREGEWVFKRELLWNANKRLKRLCKKVGSPVIRFHDLRHTFASTLVMAGVDLMQVRALMRHKSYQMTLRYAHLHPDHLKGATEVLCPRITPKKLGRAKSGGPTGT